MATNPESEGAAPDVPPQSPPAPAEPAAPARVMSIHAHPDDQEFTVGGTLAKWARAGSAVVTVCITSGNAGSNEYTPASMTREALAAHPGGRADERLPRARHPRGDLPPL